MGSHLLCKQNKWDPIVICFILILYLHVTYVYADKNADNEV